jgi:hypothetical protein
MGGSNPFTLPRNRLLPPTRHGISKRTKHRPKLPDWIAAHVHTFAYFGGAARQTVSDNLKAGITKACFYEPTVNRTYADLARHYGTAIVPARPYKPRDKAKVEVGVQVVGRWILARLRHRRFFSLAELNAAIHALLDELNDRPMRGWGISRRALFEELDRPAFGADRFGFAADAFEGPVAKPSERRPSFPCDPLPSRRGSSATACLSRIGTAAGQRDNVVLNVTWTWSARQSGRQTRVRQLELALD